MSEGFLTDVRAVDVVADDAVRLWLIRDTDTNTSALETIALSLFYYPATPEHGLALLERTAVRGSRQILEIMVKLGGYDAAWSEVHNRSWEYLRAFLPAMSQHNFTASTATMRFAWPYGTIRVSNPTALQSVLEYQGPAHQRSAVHNFELRGQSPLGSTSRDPASALPVVP
jgi:hypothetical protein